ncbi:YciI family protein [Sphingomicrobium aquimarinum]|uniref:YciI family protein n=1 Tax=Sphingomicrobium aquimarinum TaxID=3133971 RepID=UPI003D750F39
MPKFVTIGYGDRAGYDRTPSEVRAAAHAHDEQLADQGAVMGIAGKPIQVRNPENSGVTVTRTSYMSSTLPVAGFMIIEAEDIEAAVTAVSRAPCAVAHGVVEVWPLKEA